MNNAIKSALLAVATVGTFTTFIAAPAYAADAPVAENVQAKSGEFAKKKYKIKGSWSVVQRDGQTFIKLSDDFKTKKGPDLKVFLSPNSVGAVSGANAVDGSIVLGALTSNKGAQEYLVPASVNLANFSSVLIHCEAYSVLWGAGDLS